MTISEEIFNKVNRNDHMIHTQDGHLISPDYMGPEEEILGKKYHLSQVSDIGNVDVADGHIADYEDNEEGRKARAAAQKLKEEDDAETKQQLQDRIGKFDGMIHNDDGTTTDPETGSKVADDSEITNEDGSVKPKHDEIAAGAKVKKVKRAKDKKDKAAREYNERWGSVNWADGLIHRADGTNIDPNDMNKVDKCLCV